MNARPAVAARLLLATAAMALGLTLACARPGNPRGGVPDRRAPAVIETSPEPQAQVTDPQTVVRFQFNERISERPQRGSLADAVIVSPDTGPVTVDKGSDWISVRVENGLASGQVYRVTIQPVIADLFGNTMRDPFELVFSTGGQMIENAIAGQALDRITGRPTPDLTVQLLPSAPQPDTVRYVSHTDEDGLYFFRFVPPGVYDLVAFLDRNRNRARDVREPSGQRPVRVERDTLLVNVTVLEPDTSAATVVRAEAVDSTTVRVTFSDYLDPENVRTTGVVLTAPEGRTAPVVTEVLHPDEYENRRDSARARASREARGPDLAAPGQERGGLPAGLPLPRQELIVLLATPLEVGVEYGVNASGIVNINGIPLGRGDTKVVRRASPRPPAGAARDTLAPPGAATDSLGRPLPPPDSAAPRPDSAAARRDTIALVLRRRR